MHTHPNTVVRSTDGKTYSSSSPDPSGDPSDAPGTSGDYGYRKLKESTGAVGINPSLILGWRVDNVTETSISQTRVVTFHNGRGG